MYKYCTAVLPNNDMDSEGYVTIKILMLNNMS